MTQAAATPFSISIAERLVAELMPIAILVAGPGAGGLTQLLVEAGAAAETLTEDAVEDDAFDLAVLLAPPAASGLKSYARLAERLAAASPRLLYVPQLPAGRDASNPDLSELSGWLEVFTEYGCQPVVDFDAGFMGAGAFLVDREATAAESELTQFAERLSLGGALAASSEKVAELSGDRAALQAALAVREAELAAQAAKLLAVQAERDAALARLDGALAKIESLKAENAGWDALRAWVRSLVATGRSSPLTTLRAALAASGGLPTSRGRVARWLLGEPPPSAAEQKILDEAALLRAEPLFDAPWYIAANPGLAAHAADPVLHYLLIGARAGADPGPWFDSAAYLKAHPELARAGINPLVHAIRSGATRQTGAARQAVSGSNEIG